MVMMMLSICPKCGYQRRLQDTQIMEGICPACGIVYAKWRPSLNHIPSIEETEIPIEYQTVMPLTQKISELIFYVPESVAQFIWYGRLALWLMFMLWGLSFVMDGINYETIGGSFLHQVNLPFHEFGHVFFRPAGNFMMILGGSLFQVSMPLGLACVFLFQQKDTFAASIMLWWSGQNFIDISPYIADATARSLPLIGGASEEMHDWGNLLTQLNWLPYDHKIAGISFLIGTLFILLSISWGSYLLLLQKRCLQSS
jgi:hypothetical protein